MKYVTVFIVFFSILACSKGLKDKSDLKEILILHNKQREYHFNKDSIGFVSQFVGVDHAEEIVYHDRCLFAYRRTGFCGR